MNDGLFSARPLEDRIDRARGLIRLGDRKGAFRALDELLLECPDDAALIKLAGDAFYKDYPGLAATFYERAARASDGDPDPICNLGACIDSMHPEEGKKLFLAAHRRDPECRVALTNLARVCAVSGEHEEAVGWAEKALALDPEDAHALGNSSMSLLALGHWREGWRRYRYLLNDESRKELFYRGGGRDVPRLKAGETPRRLAVYGEQGLGDEVLFLSMLPETPPGETGFIETTPRMAGLIRRSYPRWRVFDTRLDAERDWPAREGVTHKLEMGGLGEFYAAEPFRRGRYLETCAVRRGMWSRELPGDRANVGLAWTGGSWKNGRGWRSCSPHVLRPLIDAHADVNFVSLEYLPHGTVAGVTDYAWCTGSPDMDNVAALIDSLDLIITVTTTVVDLAGALGVPCRVMVPTKSTWRYGTAAMGEKMHFYESVKCYRQAEHMDWSPVVERISRDLHEWKGHHERERGPRQRG